MGLQDMDKSVSVLVVDQRCESDQLLVSLCKNEAEWLSPVGWTAQKKVTLLDCRSKGEQTEIDIPQEFAASLFSGDVLSLSCSELDLEQEIVWDRSNVSTREATESSAGVGAMASSLFSRFKGGNSEPEVLGSEAERRAKDAERAAESYKAKMEAATAAKEEAHRAALNAAREAETALKMEAERIAEMERAAKAFEEAERLKQDELRRVDEERRAEEARLAEEARRIEAARKREAQAKAEAERKAALGRYNAALDVTHNEARSLSKRLDRLKDEAASLEQSRAATQSEFETVKASLAPSEKTVTKRAAAYDKLTAKLERLTQSLEQTQTESAALLSQRDELAHRLVEHETEYQSAQKAAEAAMTIAAEKRAALQASQDEETLLSSEISSLTVALEKQNLAVGEMSQKAEQSRTRYAAAQDALSTLTTQTETFEAKTLIFADKDQSLRHEIEATHQAIEDTQSREMAHRRAIVHLESGGDPDGVEQAELQSDFFEAAASNVFGDQDYEVNEGWARRMRRNFTRKADAQISIDVDDVVIDDSVLAEPVSLRKKLPNLPAFMTGQGAKVLTSQHRSSLMALGAVIGGVAIMSGGYALNKSVQKTAPKLTTKVEQPTQVASAVAKTPAVKAAPEMAETEEAKTKEVKTDLVPKAQNETVKKTTVKIDIATPELAIEKPAVKVAEAVRPKAAAAALPKAAKKTKAKTVKKKARNYPEVTRDIQERLSELGFYTGDIDGLQNKETLSAVREFKDLFGLPVNDKLTGQFLSRLKQSQQERILQQAAAAKTVEAPTIEFYDYATPVPTEPVWTDTLPAATPAPYIAPAPEPAPAQLASAPVVAAPVIAPAVEDVITPSKVIKNAGASYPANALRREYYKTAIITLSYNIGTQGDAENIQVSSNDNKSRYASAFEKEAITMLEKIKFSPKLVNGSPVVDKGNTKRVVFQVE